MESAVLNSELPVRRVALVRSKPEAGNPEWTMPCSTCSVRSVCLPCGLQPADAPSVDQLVYSRRRVRRGEHLYRTDDPFKSLYAIRLGFFKSYVVTPGGETQVTGFPMAGEVIGTDGIDSERHRLSVVALDDAQVCVIPYAHLQATSGRAPAVQHQMNRIMSREIVHGQELTALLGKLRAEARVAQFLLGLSARFAARGYSALQFHLRMTRAEIGSNLGLKLETISRVLSRLQQTGVIKVRARSVTIVDPARLKAVVSEC